MTATLVVASCPVGAVLAAITLSTSIVFGALILNHCKVMYVSTAINKRNQIGLYLTLPTRLGAFEKKSGPFFYVNILFNQVWTSLYE